MSQGFDANFACDKVKWMARASNCTINLHQATIMSWLGADSSSYEWLGCSISLNSSSCCRVCRKENDSL